MHRKTLILPLDSKQILKTSLFEDEYENIDGSFEF